MRDEDAHEEGAHQGEDRDEQEGEDEGDDVPQDRGEGETEEPRDLGQLEDEERRDQHDPEEDRPGDLHRGPPPEGRLGVGYSEAGTRTAGRVPSSSVPGRSVAVQVMTALPPGSIPGPASG